MISEEQVKLYLGGNYPELKDFFDRKVIRKLPFTEGRVVTLVGSSDNAPVANTLIAEATKLAIGTGTAQIAGDAVIVAQLAAAQFGTGRNTVIGAEAAIFNMVDIRNASDNNEVVVTVSGTDRKVWGLLQAIDTATDGDAIGTAGNENLQISFVYVNAAGALVVTALPAGSYEFRLPKIYAERYMPAIREEGGVIDQDVVDLSAKLELVQAEYKVTTAFPANDEIDLSTGAGTTGVSTATGAAATIALPASGAAFQDNARVMILRNGVPQRKIGASPDVVWDSTTSFHFTRSLAADEEFSVIAPANY